MRVSQVALLSLCASGTAAFAPTLGVNKARHRVTFARSESGGDGLLPQDLISRSEKRQPAKKTSPSDDSTKPLAPNRVLLKADMPLSGRVVPPDPVEPGSPPPQTTGGAKVLSANVDFGSTLFEKMNQSSSLSSQTKAVVETAPIESVDSEESTTTSEATMDKATATEPVEEVEEESEPVEEVEEEFEPVAETKPESVHDSSTDSEPSEKTAKATVQVKVAKPQPKSLDGSDPVKPSEAKTSFRVKTGERKKSGTALLDGGGDSTIKRTTITGSAEKSGLSSIADQPSPIKTSQVASGANVNAPSLFEQMDQRKGVCGPPKNVKRAEYKPLSSTTKPPVSDRPIVSSGMSGIADIRKPPGIRASSAGSMPSLFDQIDQQRVRASSNPPKSETKVVEWKPPSNDAGAKQPPESGMSKPMPPSGMSDIADIRRAPDSRGPSAGSGTPSLFDQIDQGKARSVATSRSRSVVPKPSALPPSASEGIVPAPASTRPITSSGMSSIADRRVPPSPDKTGAVAVPSLFDQIDQQKRAETSYLSPTEPIGWGGVVETEPLTTSADSESTTLDEVPAPPLTPKPESNVVADTESTDSIPEASAPVEKSVAVEKVESKPSAVSKPVDVGKPSAPKTRKTPQKLESKPVAPKGTDERAGKKSSPVQDVAKPASVPKTAKQVEKIVAPKQSSNPVVEKPATSKPSSPPKRTLTPLERKFAASKPKWPEKKQKVDKPEVDIETDEDSISPKLPILGSKYMARLEKAAENNPKVLREELEKRRVVDDDDDLPLADGQSNTKEEDNPFKKAFGQFLKGEKRE